MGKSLCFWILCLSLGGVIVGCSSTSKTRDDDGSGLAAELIDQKVQSNQYLLSQIQNDYDLKKRIYDHMVQSGANPDAGPYPHFRAYLDVMKSRVEQLEKMMDRLKASSEAGRTHGRDSKIIDEIEGQIRTSAQDYEQLSNSYVERANEYKITEVDVLALRKNVNHLTSEVERQMKVVRETLDTARDQISRSPAEVRKKKDPLISKIENILKEIETQSSEVILAGIDFEGEAGARSKMVVGPPMKSHRALIRLETLGQKLGDLARQYNDLVSVLNE